MNPLLIVGLISVGLSLFSVFVSKLVMDEDKLKEVRERMKENQKKLKHLKPGSDEYNKLQDQILKDSMFVTKESYKPMLYTTIVFMLALWWLSANFAYAPISVNNTISLSATGTGYVNSTCLNLTHEIPVSGNYKVLSENCSVNMNGHTIKIPMGSTKVIEKKFDNSKIEIKPHKLVFIKLPFSLPFIGDEIGYFGYYLIISLVLSSILNKALKDVRIRLPRKSP